jgi:predicted nuclease with TOPRIM domain
MPQPDLAQQRLAYKQAVVEAVEAGEEPSSLFAMAKEIYRSPQQVAKDFAIVQLRQQTAQRLATERAKTVDLQQQLAAIAGEIRDLEAEQQRIGERHASLTERAGTLRKQCNDIGNGLAAEVNRHSKTMRETSDGSGDAEDPLSFRLAE